MKTKSILFNIFSLFVATVCWGQDVPKIMGMRPEMTEVWEPEVEVVTPGDQYGDPPSDAIILFKDNLMDEWTNDKGDLPEWTVEDGVVTVGPSQLKTKRKFGSVQLHIEWRTPSVIKGTSQGRGNSGVLFQMEGMKCKCWIAMKIEHIAMGKLRVFINNMRLL